MNILKFAVTVNFLLALLLSFPSLAQMNYTLGPDPELKITGTSTLHDWDMKTSTASGQGQFQLESGKIKSAKNVTVTMPAESLKSGKSGMDRKAYDAMKTNKHKQVKFELKELQPKGDSYEATGDFTIAGTTKTVRFPVNLSISNNIINAKGSYQFKLTDFNIEPPTALLGTVKTDDKVSIHFNVKFQPTKN